MAQVSLHEYPDATISNKNMFFFIDNSEFKRNIFGTNFDYFVMGGFLCSSEDAKTLEKEIKEIKNKFGLSEEMPIKWNIRDLEKEYKRLNQLKFNELLKKSDEIRLLLINSISKTDSEIIMSATRAYNREWRKDACHWAFENILQRLGLILQVQDNHQNIYPKISVYMDWPDSNDKSFFDTYSNAYYNKEPRFLSGPLKDLGINVNLGVGSTIHSPHLQIADICVGITKDFIKWCYEGKNTHRVQKFFLPLLPKFRKNKDGKILGYGLIVGKKDEDYPLIEKKIEELRLIC